MKNRNKIMIGVVCIITVAALFYYAITDKQAYDYCKYYEENEVEEKETKETSEKIEVIINKELSLEKLKASNSDIVGIIRFADDEIYEPVVQAPDNKYYERRNFDKHYSAAGIPFVSCDGNIDSKNVVIYGHSSDKRNIIFTPIMNYLYYDYYKSHDKFKFITADEERTYQIFATLTYDTKNLNDSLEFAQSSWRKESDFDDFLKSLKEKSEYVTDVSVSNEDKLMTLVTCDTRDNSKRIVLVSKLVTEN